MAIIRMGHPAGHGADSSIRAEPGILPQNPVWRKT
jgi:hypothetical protein